jgi:hypothetical protein
VIAYLVTTAIRRSLLGRIAAAITDPAAVMPGSLDVAWPRTARSGKAENPEALTAG